VSRDEAVSPRFKEKWSLWSLSVQSVDKGRRNNSVGPMCILEILKNNRDSFIFASHCGV